MEHPWVQFWVAAGGLAAVAWLIGLAWDRYLTPLAVRAEVGVDGRMVHGARHAVQALIIAGGLLAVLSALRSYPEIAEARIIPLLDGLLHGSTVFAAAWLASRLAEELAATWLEQLGRGGDARLDERFMPLVRRVLRLVFLFVAVTVILGRYDVRITALLGAAGIASLAVALAAQETLANVIGGLTIIVDRPFRVGDAIEMPDGRTGRVREIGLRSTKILTSARSVLIVPNAELVKTSVVNHGYPDPVILVRQDLGVAYGTDLERARRVILEEVGSQSGVGPVPAPEVLLLSFGDSALGLQIVYAVPDWDARLEIRSRVNLAVLARLAREGIEMPFPQRVVHLRQTGT